MKKLYTAIMIISLALFISCNEQKAMDDIKKAFTEITDEAADVVDKATPKPQGSGTPTNAEGEEVGGKEAGGETESETTEDTPPPALTKPVFSQTSAPWDTPITFPKVAEHTYRLKEEKTGIALSEAASDTMQLTATQPAQNVIIVATFNGKTSESNPIEFTRIQGNTLSFPGASRKEDPTSIADFTLTATKSETVAEDTRDIEYSISPTGAGLTIDSSSGKVTIALDATERDYTIIAELQQNAFYKRSTAMYTLTISKE